MAQHDDNDRRDTLLAQLSCGAGHPRSFTKRAPGNTSLTPIGALITDTGKQAGRFAFAEKVQPDSVYWPVVYGWSALLQQDAAPLPPDDVLVEIGFTPSQQPIPGGAAAAPNPRWVIFRGVMVATDPETNTLVDTNFGRGWVVPSSEGLPMDFYVQVIKPGVELEIGFTLNALWGYTAAGQL